MVECCSDVSFTLTVVYGECHKLSANAEWHYAVCHYDKCRYAECHGPHASANGQIYKKLHSLNLIIDLQKLHIWSLASILTISLHII